MFACVRETYPLLARRGVFVVELLGNGKTARAVLRKGALRFLQRSTLAGHVFRLMDEAGAPVKEGAVWLDGQSYNADVKGEVSFPLGLAEDIYCALLCVQFFVCS